jgi:hypothetical protein
VSADKILGVQVQYNMDNGFMDDSQIQRKKRGMRTATIVDVLYADDCVLFTNTIRSMQIMMVEFDEVATLFGMELAITKTKVVCNQYSKAMEIEAREAEDISIPTPVQHYTRGSRELARMQTNDRTLFVPVIVIRRENIEVMPQFRYLGVLDTDDGALDMEIQARICRMKQRFKEFEGRIFWNNEVSTLPRLQVLKCMVLTNGIYASEVWNYTRKGMDRLEKHYFRLLRNTLFLAKYDTTYLTVLNTAREQGVVKLYPLECYAQRQQLKFLWKILHLNDLALQRIVLHSKMDSQFSRGRGGRQRTYKQCIIEALGNFGVTMAQCMDMKQQDWDLRIEGIGLETAAQRWEARPKASTPIDKEWRTAGARTPGRTAATASAEQVDGVDSENAIADDDSEFGESETEDELAQSQGSQEQTNGRANYDEEDMTPWEGAKCTKDRNEEATTRRPGARHRNGHISANRNAVDRSDNNQHNAEGSMDTTDRQQIEGLSDAKHGAQDSEVAKRKVKRDDRHRKRNKRNNKRAWEEMNTANNGRHETQRELQLIVVGDGTTTSTNASAMPWEHRGLLGQTGRRRDAGDHRDT